MSAPFVIYGATGHSGGLVARRAVDRGLAPVLAGRDAAKTAALAASLGVTSGAAPLDDAAALRRMFEGAVIVLNAAGPLSRTTTAVVDACLAAGAHYLKSAKIIPTEQIMTYFQAASTDSLVL